VTFRYLIALAGLLLSAQVFAEDRFITEVRCSGSLPVSNWFFISTGNPARVRSVNHSEVCSRLNDSTLGNQDAAVRVMGGPKFGLNAYHRGFSLVLRFRF
jgi:hypothetical protein